MLEWTIAIFLNLIDQFVIFYLFISTSLNITSGFETTGYKNHTFENHY